MAIVAAVGTAVGLYLARNAAKEIAKSGLSMIQFSRSDELNAQRRYDERGLGNTVDISLDPTPTPGHR